MVFLAAVVVIIGLAVSSEVAAAELTQLPGCQFAVSFPGRPDVQEILFAGQAGEVRGHRASYKSGTGIFRHECTCQPRLILSNPVPPEYARSRLRLFAESNGLSYISMTPLVMPGATSVEMRGTKVIDGTPATFLLRVIATNECYVDALVAGRATDFPAQGMLEFLGSIGRKVPSASREPRWIEFHRLPTGPTRAIDVANLKVDGDLMEYTRRYITSFDGRLLMVSQMSCGRGESRLLHVEEWSKEGELRSRVDYGDQAEFFPGPNDITHQLLLRALCAGGRPVPVSKAEENLKAVRGW